MLTLKLSFHALDTHTTANSTTNATFILSAEIYQKQQIKQKFKVYVTIEQAVKV